VRKVDGQESGQRTEIFLLKKAKSTLTDRPSAFRASVRETINILRTKVNACDPSDRTVNLFENKE